MGQRLVFGDEVIVTAGEGRRGERGQGEEAEEQVHGRKCVGKVYPTHALW
jgi:hypothetical protein